MPALALQSEYGFTVSPYLTSGGSSLTPEPTPEGPDPKRERATGYDAWRKAGVDSMLVVPRASTHLEYTDIPLVLPASRYGQALSSHYVQAWLDRYLKHQRNDSALTGQQPSSYLEPAGNGRWKPVTLQRGSLLSFYYCSAYGFRSGSRVLSNGDIARVGGCLSRLVVPSLVGEGESVMAAVSPSPLGAEFFLDTRGDARSLRVRWHHSDGLVLLSLWRGARVHRHLPALGRRGARS